MTGNALRVEVAVIHLGKFHLDERGELPEVICFSPLSVNSWMTGYSDTTFSNSGFGVESMVVKVANGPSACAPWTSVAL